VKNNNKCCIGIIEMIMLTCAFRTQDKKPKRKNIPSNFMHSIYNSTYTLKKIILYLIY